MTGMLNETWIEIGEKQAKVFTQEPAVYLGMLVKSRVLRELLCGVYLVMVKLKKELPLEALSESERREIWESAKAEAAGTINQEECIKLAKALYTINCFLNQ